MTLKKTLVILTVIITLVGAGYSIVIFYPQALNPSGINAPGTVYNQTRDNNSIVKPCSNEHPEWRSEQIIESVSIKAAPDCEPDNPYEVATSVKGTNQVSIPLR